MRDDAAAAVIAAALFPVNARRRGSLAQRPGQRQYCTTRESPAFERFPVRFRESPQSNPPHNPKKRRMATAGLPFAKAFSASCLDGKWPIGVNASKRRGRSGKARKPAGKAEMESASREQQIRERAYVIWEGEGRPMDRAEAHWLQAEAEIAQEQARPDGAGAPPPKRARAAVTRKRAAAGATVAPPAPRRRAATA